MALTAAAAPSAFKPSDYGQLLVATTSKASIAIQTTTLVTTDKNEFRIPRVTSEVTSGWYGENADITLADPGLSEEVVRPRKTASLTRISNELANDSTPAADQVIGESAARSIATTIDFGLFAVADGTGTPPKGLGSFANSALTYVDAGEYWGNIDPFIEAIFDVETEGGSLSSFIANPADAEILAKLKKSTTSNEPLLAPDANSATRRSISGVPLYVSAAVPVGSVYGFTGSRIYTVLRSDVTVETDKSLYFGSDGTAIRGIARVGFGFPHPKSIARISLTPEG